jgi:Ni,Fe-hydrogenase III large subunit
MSYLPTTDEPLELPDWLPEHLGAEAESGPPGELRLAVEPLGLARAAARLREAGGRFVTIFLAARPEPSLCAAIAIRGHVVLLRAPYREDASYGSLSDEWQAARWSEIELVEREAVKLVGLPGGPHRLTDPEPDRIGSRVDGFDAFAIPYGPVRSGVFEAIQFMIETGGEDVPRLETRPFFKHRGMEERFEGLDPDRATYVAERVAGIASVAYASAFAQAVERALGVKPPPRAERWRAVHAELERLANHLDVISKEAETAALSVGQARFQILKENVMRLRAALCGSRFGRGVIVPGGVRFDGRVDLDPLLEALDAFERELARDRRLFLGTASMTDRLINAGRLARATVEDFGAVGPLARGSGVSTDARHERPYGDYHRLGLQVVTARAGDAMARIEVRFGEMFESLRILRQALDQLRRRDGELRVALPAGAEGEAFGWAEAPQGEVAIWVELEAGRLRRVRIASPSFRNWALFDHAFPKDVLTDFAFIEHSFGLTPAGADR